MDAKALKDLQSWLPWRRAAAVRALGASGDPRALPLIIGRLCEDTMVRDIAATALTGRPDAATAVHRLREWISPDPDERERSRRGLSGRFFVGEPLLVVLWDAGPSLRGEVEAALNTLVQRAVARASDGRLDGWLVELLQALGDPRVPPVLVHALVSAIVSPSAVTVPLVLPLMDAIARHGQAALPAVRTMSGHRRPRVREAGARMLVALGDPDGHDQLVSALDELMRAGDSRAAEELARSGKAGILTLLRAFAENRIEAPATPEAGLRAVPSRALAEVLLGLLQTVDGPRAALPDHLVAEPWLRGRAVNGWAEMGGSAVEPLLTALHWPDARVRLWVVLGLVRIGSPPVREALRSLLGSPQPQVRTAAAVALGCLHDPAAMEPLRAALAASDPETQAAVAHALGGLGCAAGAAIAELHDTAESAASWEVRSACAEAVRVIEAAVRAGPAELEAGAAPAGRGTELEQAGGSPEP